MGNQVGTTESNTMGDVFEDVKNKKTAAVVSIEMNYPRNFGINAASSSSATGFIVSAAKGVILTNKHVVQEGPVRAKARFLKHEELDLVPIYRDPVHDFGFFRFDPKQLTATDLTEIELFPEGATKGTKTLIIGNNGGERISYVETTVARTDRPAPTFLDLNTFYITASDTGVGGSSGAPMLNSEGRAIAMVAAGNDSTNISMYLPLYRVQRALEYLLNDTKIPRGTLQVGYKHVTFESLRKKNNVSQAVVDDFKKAEPKSEGLLVVEKTLPDGPGFKAGIKNGDIILKLNNSYVHNFVQVEESIDSFLGIEVTFSIIRENEPMEIKATVQDLDEITNFQYVEISNGIFHNIQYLLAVYFNLPMKGVFLAKQGYMFSSLPFGAIIKKVNGVKINTLNDFVEAIKALPNSKLVPIKYQPLKDQNKSIIETCVVDKRWFPFHIATRNDKLGTWERKDMTSEPIKAVKNKDTPSPVVARPVSKRISQTAGETNGAPSADIPEKAAEAFKLITEKVKFARAIVDIVADSPFSLSGNSTMNNVGLTGVIVDKALGLVVTCNEYIRHTMIDVTITFETVLTISAKVVYVDPLLPFSFLQYNPADLQRPDAIKLVDPMDLKLSELRTYIGEELVFVGTQGSEIKVRKSEVKGFRDINPSGGEMAGHSMSQPPNEAILVTKDSGYGIYLDKDDAIKAISFISGNIYPSEKLLKVFNAVRTALTEHKLENLPSGVRMLPITLTFTTISHAINSLGLTPDWTRKLIDSCSILQKKLLVVKKRMVTEEVHEKLRENDVVLAIDGTPTTLIREYYERTVGKDSVKLSILREGEVFETSVKTKMFSTTGTSRIIHLAGLTIQDLPYAICYLSKPEILKDGGLYVAHMLYGSPTHAAEAQGTEYNTTTSIVGKLLIKVDKTDIHTLDDLLREVGKKNHNDYIRLTAKDIEHGELSVHDIRLDLEYWGTKEVLLNSENVWETKHQQVGDKPASA